MILNPVVHDRVKIVNVPDVRISGYFATIMGFHGSNEYPIILFDVLPQDYTPATVISVHCLERI